MPCNKLNIEYKDIQSLNPYKNNPRVHSKEQIHKIAESIKTFGFTCPVLFDRNGTIIAGHGRVAAAEKLGWTEVPAIALEHLSEAQTKAYVIADNRLTEISQWDDALLASEFKVLGEMDVEFDLDVTGFEMAEIDAFLHLDIHEEEDEADLVPDVTEGNPVTKKGDVWQLGKHKLICGDSLEAETYQKLMGADKAQVIFTDPPYNVPIDGHVCGNGKVKHEEFAMAAGEMSEKEFISFLETFMNLAKTASMNGALHYVCMDWRHMYELLHAGKSVYKELKNICVWNKNNGGMGTLYRSKHEMVAVFKNGTKPHINNVQLGKHGRYRTNVWDYKGVNSFGSGQSDLAMHPTVKPVQLVEDAVLDSTKRGHIVLDPFSGSGSTLIACERSGRKARCIEYEPKYCDVIIQRWQDLSGGEAIHLETGEMFNAMKERASDV